MRRGQAYLVAGALAVGALLGAVSLGWGDPSGAQSAGKGDGKPQAAGDGLAKQTPLLMSVLNPPQPVKGTDGKYHLAYELLLTNTSPGTARVGWIKTRDAKSGEVVGTLAGPDVAARTTRVGDISGETTGKIESGQVAIVYLDVTFEQRSEVPRVIEHRVRTNFDLPSGLFTNLFPAQTTDSGARTTVVQARPVVVDPPLKGKNWVAANACCNVSPHRGAMLAFHQRLLATERYAIDYIQSDDEGHLVFPGDDSRLRDFPAYGKPVLAVANAKVVKVVEKFPDVKPGVLDPDLTLQEAGGNYVILDIGGGKYAFYAHLKPNSIEVKVGDRVSSGQKIARLGNSGNTTFPHLHFQVVDAPLAVGANNNLPYVFDSLTYQGYIDDELTPHLLDNPQPREEELPLAQSVVTFPAP